VSAEGKPEPFRLLILEQIQRINSRIDVASLDPEKSLTQQGCDSLDLISLFTALSVATGHRFPGERLSEMLTISSISGFLAEMDGSSSDVGRLVGDTDRLV